MADLQSLDPIARFLYLTTCIEHAAKSLTAHPLVEETLQTAWAGVSRGESQLRITDDQRARIDEAIGEEPGSEDFHLLCALSLLETLLEDALLHSTQLLNNVEAAVHIADPEGASEEGEWQSRLLAHVHESSESTRRVVAEMLAEEMEWQRRQRSYL